MIFCDPYLGYHYLDDVHQHYNLSIQEVLNIVNELAQQEKVNHYALVKRLLQSESPLAVKHLIDLLCQAGILSPIEDEFGTATHPMTYQVRDQT